MTRTASQLGRASRAKGGAWERAVATLLATIYPGATRNLSQTRSAAREGGDILGTPYHVECKCGARVDIGAAWRQAVHDRGARSAPILLVVREHRRTPFVVLDVVMRGCTVRARVELAAWVQAELDAAGALLEANAEARVG